MGLTQSTKYFYEDNRQIILSFVQNLRLKKNCVGLFPNERPPKETSFMSVPGRWQHYRLVFLFEIKIFPQMFPKVTDITHSRKHPLIGIFVFALKFILLLL
jgi:hypothetical protein